MSIKAIGNGNKVSSLANDENGEERNTAQP